jgi:hypothetical protein
MSTTVIGPFTAGEIPPPLVIIFKDAAGTAIDFSANGPWAGRFVYRSYGGAFVTKTLTAPNLNTGAVTVTWVSADMATAGDYEGEAWVGNGTNRYDSEPLSWQVRSAVANPAPVI